MQLIKVSVTLDKIEKPLDPPWRPRAAAILMIAGAALLVGGFAEHSVIASVAAFPAFFAGLVASQGGWIFLPASARHFRSDTYETHRDLVRRTEAFNRAWCLAERGQESLSSPGGIDPFKARYEKLRAEVDAYACRYRAADAVDLERIDSGAGRRAARQAIVDRSKDLVELEAKLDELGKDADPGMRERARALRTALEKDCIKAGLPLGLVRLCRPSRPPALPAARIVSSDRP
ncbi:MAG TPA: hypothetical protein VL283_04325 [Candidatus Baltobacteraceae bacterium]|nr:hypothetical protein [Candidatus Baltobacteraceae bacterium]